MKTDPMLDEKIILALKSARVIAMLGASPNPDRASHNVMELLLSKGHKVIPINPGQAGKGILGQRVFATLGDIPEPVDMVDVFRPSSALPGIMDEVLALPNLPKVFWTQLDIYDDEQAARAEAKGIVVIQNRCPAIEYSRLRGKL
ncbi:MAG: CoA-binding protein [Notoacmeibacter sp.]